MIKKTKKENVIDLLTILNQEKNGKYKELIDLISKLSLHNELEYNKTEIKKLKI